MMRMRFKRFKELDYQAGEAINTLCTNLFFAGGDYKKIMVTSCHPHEGKSFVAMNLMRALGRLGMRVVLVDADIRASALQATYGLGPEEAGEIPYEGLTRYLAGRCTADDILIQTDLPNAWMILAGKTVNNSLPLLNSPRMKHLLDGLAKEFDIVLVDTPPVGTVIDAAKILQGCDGVLFVVKSEEVRPQELQAALAQIQKTGKPLLGTVLNQFDNRKNGKAYGYYYSSNYYGGNQASKREQNKKRTLRQNIRAKK